MWTAVVACLIGAALCLVAVVSLEAAGSDFLGVRDLALRGVFVTVLLALGIGSSAALVAVLSPRAEDGETDEHAVLAHIQTEAARRAARDAIAGRLQESAQLMSVRLESTDEVRAWRSHVQSWYDGTYLFLRERVSAQAADRFSRAPARQRRFVRAATAEHREWLGKLYGWRDQLGQIARRV